MAAIDFPSTPTLNQQVTLGGFLWQWDGAVWRKINAGKSAYAIAVDNGFVGTEAQWLASLVGAAGATGATGATGPQGPSGSPTRTIRSVSASTSLQSGDLNQMIRFTGTSTQVLTVNDVLTPGTSVEIIQDNSGRVEFQSGAGVTLLSSSGIFRTRGQNSVVTLRCVASGQYRITGDVQLVDPISATGGTITTSGGYTIHTFTSSGTFQVTSGTGQLEYLVVAGGGGGGQGASTAHESGGGGAGGLLTSSVAGSAGSYTVTVGAGGSSNTNGNNSVFGATITAVGGGRGATGAGTTGGSGGSGGGGCHDRTAGGAGTAGQGFAGGTPTSSSSGGGGGGAGQAGQGGNFSTGVPANGGNGVQTSISGLSNHYAGGGAGYVPGVASTGGLGGGASKSGSGSDGSPGTTNTGGGGSGGGGPTSLGGAGGSGIVIVRYLTNG